MILVVATRNSGKLRELRKLLGDTGVELRCLADFPAVPDVDESAGAYAANALTKAETAARATGLPALGDDSGLEVDALDGAPGVHSARYSGGGPAANIGKLLCELRHVPSERRTARFRCVIAVVRPGGERLLVEASCEGRIAAAVRGAGGFGYDPVFIDPETGCTFAELPPEQKDRISHRGRACAELRRRLVSFLTHGKA